MRRVKQAFMVSVGLIVCGPIGCEHMSNTFKGGAIGAGAGTGVGALIGHASGNTGAGALIGAGVGTVAGSLIGNDIDQQEKHDLQGRVIAAEAREVDAHQQLAAQHTLSEVTLDQVISMSRSGVPDEVIINQIRTTQSGFHLSSADISYLKTNAVSDRVILEMQNTRHAPPPVVSQPPTVIRRPREVIIEHDPPVIIHRRPPTRVIEVVAPPPRGPHIHFGAGFYNHGRCW